MNGDEIRPFADDSVLSETQLTKARGTVTALRIALERGKTASGDRPTDRPPERLTHFVPFQDDEHISVMGTFTMSCRYGEYVPECSDHSLNMLVIH